SGGSRPASARDHESRDVPKVIAARREVKGTYGASPVLTDLPLQAAALTLGEATPDSEALIVLEGELEARFAEVAGGGGAFGLEGRSALFREEGVGIGLGAEGLLLPVPIYRLEKLRQVVGPIDQRAGLLI